MKQDNSLVNKILNEWNNTDAPYSSDKCIHELFEERVALQPDNLALITSDEKLTYKELNHKANQVARVFSTLGIKENTFVGILLPRSTDMIVSLYAILKNGAAYVPLNLTDPLERIILMSKNADIEYIVTTNEFKENLTKEGLKVIHINEIVKEITDHDNHNLEKKIDPESYAYIIFTSGTTGTPKGVLVKHQPVINLIEWVNSTFNVGKDDKLIWTTNLSFDLSVYDIFGILAAGATVRILDDKERMDPEKQLNILFKEKITFWDSAPQSFQRLIPFFRHFQKIKNENSLRLVFFSGDWIPLKLPEEIKSLFPWTTIVGLGGATEATIWSNYFVIDHIDRKWKSIPYGKPIQNAKYYILNENLQHCDILTPGDLYIGGECLASGYYNDEKLTSFKFIPDPYNQGFKMYMTGDKAQWMKDGNIEFLGREDQQVKIRGYRVELGEIKQAALNFKDIQDCVVVPDKTDRYNVKIFCFCITQNTGSFDKAGMMAYLSGKLPDYMLPTDLITVQKFPITTNGKIDSKSLLNTYLEEQQKESLSKQPNIEGLQKTLFDIWAELLGHSNFSINDDFKDVGGNSLFVYRFIARLKEKTTITLSFLDLNNYPYISALSDLIRGRTNISKKAIKIIHNTKNTKLPLSSQQIRIWLTSLMYPDAPVYNENFNYVLSGYLDENKFREALGLLVNRHIILSSTFKYDDNGPWCDLTQNQPNLSILDFSDNSADDRDNIFQFLDKQTKLLFDFNKGPLYRFNLIKLNVNEYIFQFVVHHIIFDGLSFQLLIRDLSEIYNHLAFQQDLRLPEIQVTQYDFAEWEFNAFDRVQTEISLNYWKKQLTGMPGILNFPYDYSRPETSSGYGDRIPFEISADLSKRLRELSHRCNCTLYVTMLSFFGILIKKYTNDEDFCIGLPVSCKHDSLLEYVIGMFVNTIPMRFTFEDEENIADLAKNIKEKLAESIDHQNVPFEKIVEAINPERINDINPFFQVSFAWQEAMVTFKMKGIESSRYVLRGGVSPFEIACFMWDNGEIIEGEFEYNIDLLRQETIIRLKDNFITLLENHTKNPDASIDVISIISENDKKKLEEFNNTAVKVPDFLVQDFFEKQSELTPLKTAVISGSESLNYRDLDCWSNQLARHLLSLGVTSGNIVGICLDRSIGMAVSVLAVLKAGCCYLPMDPSFPDDRIKYMFEDSGAKILISQSSLKDKFRTFVKTSFVFIDEERSKLSSYSALKPNLKLSSQSLAYIIYTSGSTGTPKGVKVHHQAVVNFLNSMLKKPGFNNKDRLLAVTTLSFDISVLELFLPLSSGAELVIAEIDDIIDGQKLSGLLKRNDITIMQATPATWNLLLGSGWTGKKNMKALCGGEAISTSLVKDLLPKVESLWNMYGPTETTVWSTCFQLIDLAPPILIGAPIDNTKIYILDKSNNLLPVGCIGEVCIGGLGVSKGYHNRPDLTTEKFIPFDNSQTIYKTGDLGRFLIDGNIELFGRIDNQIKLRGFRIEPGEIETLLTQLKGVKESVVKVHRFDDNDERLIAFLNVTAEFKMTNEEIIESLTQKLPPYMIPSFLQKSDDFPRLPNGKINKKALLFRPDDLDRRPEVDFNSLTDTQKRLINIWEDILKIKNVPHSENFFDLGGNSLLAIRIINKIKEELGFTLTFRELIANPTINQLGILIDSQYRSSAKAIELIHLTDTRNLPLSINQKRIWLVCKLYPDVPAYIISYTYQLLGSLNLEAFQKSLEILSQRHHIIFSTFKQLNGEPYCDIVPTNVYIEFIDYSELPLNEKDEKIVEFIDNDSTKVFDLENGPLYRLYLIKTDTNEYYFHISIHHIIFDGWSWPVFINDLEEIYNSLLTGKEIRLEKIEFQQYDYAHWEQTSAHLINKNELTEFWKETLKDVTPFLNFPYDFPRKSQPSGIGGLEIVQLPQELSRKLRKISKEENSSLFITMLGAFGILLRKYSGEDDICIGTPVAHRPHSRLENIFGMFVNTIVVRLKFEKDLTFKNVIHLTKEAALNAIAHQDLPFENIVEIVNPERSSNINPLFQVCFVWQNNLNIPMKLIRVRSKRVTGREVNAIFDINLAMWENGENIEGEIEYNSDILKRDTVIRLKDNFLTLISNMVENSDNPIESLPMMSDEERKMIKDFTDARTDYPKNKTIVQLFEEQVDLYPDKTAVVFKEEILTYIQLNEKTNQLACTLRGMGVKRNTPVGILVEKSTDMIVGILGILKAGGAYVPIDPEYPEQRIYFMIKDAGCRILLTQKEYMEVSAEGVTRLDLNSPASYHKEKSNVERINISADLAYIMYTSGTTGVPKGSLIQQYSVVRLVRNINYIELTSDDRILLTGAIVFDATTFEIWGALLNGGTVYVVEKETILSPKALGEELLKNDITILWLTSPLFTQIAETRTDIFGNLKYLLVGGDVLSAGHINKVRKDNRQLKIINGYGPTENTTFSTTYLIEKNFDHNIPIGKPVSNSTAYIFDKNMNYQPIGVIGELYVGGDGLSKGYLNRDDLNRTSFIDHPHIPGERIYKTGDRARWLTDGNIEFHGRIDNQLKIRGFRVELEEIETAISEIEGTIETVVKPIKIQEGDTRLAAFLHVSDTFSMNIKELSRWVREKLPPYMVPSAYKIMNDFPKTINGKIDKDALTLDMNDLVSRESQDIKTLTPTERKILDIWCDALKTKDILTTDNFFDIGGNSLLAISVFSQIESVFGIEFSLRVFFDSPRIKNLAEAIDIKIYNIVQHKYVKERKDDKAGTIKGEI